MTATAVTRAVLGCAAALTLGVAACGDFALSARNLQISPDTAYPGDSVVFAFELIVFPAQQFTIAALIDGATHLTEVRTEQAAGPVVINAGDAADLIGQYGVGTHEGAIEVRLQSGERTATASHTFVLQPTPPPLEAGP